MIKPYHHSKGCALLSVVAVYLACACIFAAQVPSPSEADLIRLAGESIASGVKVLKWNAPDPKKTELIIYAAEPASYSSTQLLAMASSFGVKGDIWPLPSDFPSSPGYWIKQPNPTNHPWFKSVSFSEKSGAYGFATDQSDFRWDLKNHSPLVRGVPTPEEALRRTLMLLPLFNIKTNELEHTSDGKLRWGYTTEGTTYNDKADKQRKRFVRRINVMLWQRVHDGASTLSIGGGGMFEASFISEGHLASVQFLFRKMKSVGKAKPMSRKEIIDVLKRGNARSFQPSSVGPTTVTNCALVYPQHNSDHRQDFVWPFYSVSGYTVRAGETNSVHVYIPLTW
jgi:hypothetical protein